MKLILEIIAGELVGCASFGVAVCVLGGVCRLVRLNMEAKQNKKEKNESQ